MLSSVPHAQQSAMLVGSVDFVDEHSHGWAIRARGGELAVQTFAGAAGASRLDAKYDGAPAAVTTVNLLDPVRPRYGLADSARIADILDANAHTDTYADATDRYGTPIHGNCVLTRAREDATALLALEPVAWYKGADRTNSRSGGGDLVGVFGRGGASDDIAYLQSTSSTDALVASSPVVMGGRAHVTIAMALRCADAAPHGAVAAFGEHVRIDFVDGMLVLTTGDVVASYAFAAAYANAWTHIVAVFDAVAAAHHTQLFLNGARAYPTTVVDAGMPVVPTIQATLSIGRQADRPSVPGIKLSEILLFLNENHTAVASTAYAHFQAVAHARQHTYDFRLASHIACTTASDAFTHMNVASWLHGNAQHSVGDSDGVWLPGTVCWRFGPLLPRVAYSIDLVATGLDHTNVLAVARTARITLSVLTAGGDSGAPLEQLTWQQSAASATATIALPTRDDARARMRLVVHLDDHAARTNFTFAVRGSGERAYIPATALLHGIGRARFDDANLVLPTTTPGVHLAVRAIGTELAPIPGQREAAVVVDAAVARPAAAAIIASPALEPTSVRAGDKLRIRQPVSYAHSIGAGSSTILDFRNEVVPVGGEGVAGIAVRLRVSPAGASVAIPTTRIPAMAHPGDRGRNGRYTLRPCDGRIVVTLNGGGASAARFDVVVKAVRAGSAVAVDNADIELIESLWSVPAGTHPLSARVANMPDVTHVIIEVASAFEGIVLVDVAVNGYALIGPPEHVFASDVVFERTCIVATGGARVRAAAIDVNGGTRIFDHAGNLHIDALDVNALRVLGAVAATGVVRLGDGDRRIVATAAGVLRLDGNAHVRGTALRMGRAKAIDAATAEVRLLEDGAHTLTAQTSSWLHGRLVVAAVAGGQGTAALRMAGDVFDGASARVLGVGGVGGAYVGLFSGVHVCHVADTWRGSRLLVATSIGLLARTTGLFHEATPIAPMHAMPIVELCDGPQSKAVYGIVVDAFARGDHTPYIDGSVLCVRGIDTSDAPARVALVTSGQAGCWVLDTNGDVRNGDLLQSALASGFAERQTSDDIGVCTVGKSTSASANWNGPQHPETPADARSAFIGVVVHCG